VAACTIDTNIWVTVDGDDALIPAREGEARAGEN
jgi:hypothetical protein